MSKVLLIDDDLSILKAWQGVLKSEGYEVVTASSAADGLAAANTGNFQVVVTDWKMPDGTGMEIIKTLRATQPRLPCW